MSSHESDFGMDDVSGRKPPQFGHLHERFQQFDADVTSVKDLLASLAPHHNPIGNWNNDKNLVIPQRIKTWFPRDKNIVLHAPSDEEDKLTRTTSFAQLHELLEAFPRYQPCHSTTFVVAILLPTSLMAETAVSVLAVMSHGEGICAAPLDPAMTTDRLEHALKQLDCRALITTEELWQDIEAMVPKNVICKLEDVRLVSPKKGSNLAGDITCTFVRRGLETDKTDRLPKGSDVAERPVLLLRTSGTTSEPKIVPLTAPALLFNAIRLASFHNLCRADVYLNALPMFFIGGIGVLLPVLVSGSGMILNGPFEAIGFLERIMAGENDQAGISPTWCGGVPTMHTSLVLILQEARRKGGSSYSSNKLRWITCGGASLSHETAVELAQLLETTVYFTYAMSECMPICYSSNPIQGIGDSRTSDALTPVGVSVRIIDTVTGEILPHGIGIVGEVCIKGPGVIKYYLNVSETHTPDGWLRTGDVGFLDSEGQLHLKGRIKEMIKRGGYQVWPKEIDDVVESVEGVSTAVAFGVPNEIWGEEVAVAIVLDDVGKARPVESIREQIFRTCREKLGTAAVPMQIAVVDSVSSLLKGPTGKYLRTGMAQHLNLSAVDTKALSALQDTPDAAAAAIATKQVDVFDGIMPESPSDALNGLRLLAVLSVVQAHAGCMPSAAWTKIQNLNPCMMLLFAIGAIQLAATTKGDVCGTWSTFVGTKIGSMHASFVIAELINFSSYVLLFMCGEEGYQEKFEDTSCKRFLGGWIVESMFRIFLPIIETGTDHATNGTTWFQSVFYAFLMLFPLVHRSFRRCKKGETLALLAFFVVAATMTYPFVFFVAPFLRYRPITWMPLSIASMLVGYRFLRISSDEKKKGGGEHYTVSFRQITAIMTDSMTSVVLLVSVLVAISPGTFVSLDGFAEATPIECFNVSQSLYEGLRPKQEVANYIDSNITATMCDITFDEYDAIRRESEPEFYGDVRLISIAGFIAFWLGLALPLVLLWLYFLCFNEGLTVRLLSSKIMTRLSLLGYPIYLLHPSVLRYYWAATRGQEAQKWWWRDMQWGVPIHWYEVVLVTVITAVLGWILEKTVVPIIMPYSIKACIGVAKLLEKCFSCCCCLDARYCSDDQHGTTVFAELALLMRSLTGSEVTHDTKIADFGFDSLGATAILGSLRASISAAKNLTMAQLTSFETMGELAEFLEGRREGDDTAVPDIV